MSFPIFTFESRDPSRRVEFPLQVSKFAGKLLPTAIAVAGRCRCSDLPNDQP